MNTLKVVFFLKGLSIAGVLLPFSFLAVAVFSLLQVKVTEGNILLLKKNSEQTPTKVIGSKPRYPLSLKLFCE